MVTRKEALPRRLPIVPASICTWARAFCSEKMPGVRAILDHYRAEPVDRAPRTGRNPHTGQAVPIPATRTPRTGHRPRDRIGHLGRDA